MLIPPFAPKSPESSPLQYRTLNSPFIASNAHTSSKILSELYMRQLNHLHYSQYFHKFFSSDIQLSNSSVIILSILSKLFYLVLFFLSFQIIFTHLWNDNTRFGKFLGFLRYFFFPDLSNNPEKLLTIPIFHTEIIVMIISFIVYIGLLSYRRIGFIISPMLTFFSIGGFISNFLFIFNAFCFSSHLSLFYISKSGHNAIFLVLPVLAFLSFPGLLVLLFKSLYGIHFGSGYFKYIDSESLFKLFCIKTVQVVFVGFFPLYQNNNYIICIHATFLIILSVRLLILLFSRPVYPSYPELGCMIFTSLFYIINSISLIICIYENSDWWTNSVFYYIICVLCLVFSILFPIYEWHGDKKNIQNFNPSYLTERQLGSLIAHFGSNPIFSDPDILTFILSKYPTSFQLIISDLCALIYHHSSNELVFSTAVNLLGQNLCNFFMSYQLMDIIEKTEKDKYEINKQLTALMDICYADMLGFWRSILQENPDNCRTTAAYLFRSVENANNFFNQFKPLVQTGEFLRQKYIDFLTNISLQIMPLQEPDDNSQSMDSFSNTLTDHGEEVQTSHHIPSPFETKHQISLNAISQEQGRKSAINIGHQNMDTDRRPSLIFLAMNQTKKNSTVSFPQDKLEQFPTFNASNTAKNLVQKDKYIICENCNKFDWGFLNVRKNLFLIILVLQFISVFICFGVILVRTILIEPPDPNTGNFYSTFIRYYQAALNLFYMSTNNDCLHFDEEKLSSFDKRYNDDLFDPLFCQDPIAAINNITADVQKFVEGDAVINCTKTLIVLYQYRKNFSSDQTFVSSDPKYISLTLEAGKNMIQGSISILIQEMSKMNHEINNRKKLIEDIKKGRKFIGPIYSFFLVILIILIIFNRHFLKNLFWQPFLIPKPEVSRIFQNYLHLIDQSKIHKKFHKLLAFYDNWCVLGFQIIQVILIESFIFITNSISIRMIRLWTGLSEISIILGSSSACTFLILPTTKQESVQFSYPFLQYLGSIIFLYEKTICNSNFTSYFSMDIPVTPLISNLTSSLAPLDKLDIYPFPNTSRSTGFLLSSYRTSIYMMETIEAIFRNKTFSSSNFNEYIVTAAKLNNYYPTCIKEYSWHFIAIRTLIITISAFFIILSVTFFIVSLISVLNYKKMNLLVIRLLALLPKKSPIVNQTTHEIIPFDRIPGSQLDSILNALPVGFIGVDKEGRIVIANQAASQYLHSPELKGKQIDGLFGRSTSIRSYQRTSKMKNFTILSLSGLYTQSNQNSLILNDSDDYYDHFYQRRIYEVSNGIASVEIGTSTLAIQEEPAKSFPKHPYFERLPFSKYFILTNKTKERKRDLKIKNMKNEIKGYSSMLLPMTYKTPKQGERDDKVFILDQIVVVIIFIPENADPSAALAFEDSFLGADENYPSLFAYDDIQSCMCFTFSNYESHQSRNQFKKEALSLVAEAYANGDEYFGPNSLMIGIMGASECLCQISDKITPSLEMYHPVFSKLNILLNLAQPGDTLIEWSLYKTLFDTERKIPIRVELNEESIEVMILQDEIRAANQFNLSPHRM